MNIGSQSLTGRVNGQDWPDLSGKLLEQGFAVTEPLLTDQECDSLIAGFDADETYRKHVVMARHNYGRGDYKYFAYPLPEVVGSLRQLVYPHLAPVANEWATRLRKDMRFPDSHEEYQQACHDAGQVRPTPLVLRYQKGDFNCLHRDLYGDLYFPYQMVFLLSDPERNFEGGEFMLVENRPRAQSVGSVVQLQKGQAIIFAVNERPRMGARGYHRTTMRHGVSELRSGARYTLGIIFHDAK